MLKNLSDYVSLIVLVVLVIMTLRVFIWSLLLNNSLTKKVRNTFELFFNYLDNEDE